MADSKFPVHPLIKKLTAGKSDAGAVKLLGYFGSSADGAVKIYPSLDDLSSYAVVKEADIIHVEDAPADELPHGGSAIWVKSDASVEYCVTQRTSTEARFLAGDIAAQMAGGPATAFAAGGGGGIGPGQTWGGDGCNFSVWPCSVVWGACLKSNDTPCANTEQYWCPGNIYTAKSCFTCAGYTCVRNCYSVGCPPSQKFCPTGQPISHCCEVK